MITLILRNYQFVIPEEFTNIKFFRALSKEENLLWIGFMVSNYIYSSMKKGNLFIFRLLQPIADNNNHALLKNMLSGIKGDCFGDKGYLSKLWNKLYENGLKLVPKSKRNAKNMLTLLQRRYLLTKRAIIESVNDILTSVLIWNIPDTENPSTLSIT